MSLRYCCLVLFAPVLLSFRAEATEGVPVAREAVSMVLADGNFEITSPQGHLRLKLPENHLTPAARSADDVFSPDYFQLICALPGLIVAGWFAPAGDYDGVQSLWKNELKGLTDDGQPAPRNIVFLKRGDWEIISYHVPLPTGTNAHLRAERVQGGVWLDLHLSIISTQPPITSREKLLALLQSMTVEEK